MKKLYALLVVLWSISIGYAQSPYALSPDWYFGQGGRLTFPNGNFPNSGLPTTGFVPTTTGGVEASTSVCFTSGNVGVYTNTMHAFNGNPANADFNDNIRIFNPFGDNVCSGSATGGGVSFPDPVRNNYPAGNIANDAFYVILANDLTGGACGSRGLNRYRFTGTGVGVAYNAGPVAISTNVFPNESITACTDGAGGYWVITHTKQLQNTFRVWRYTAAGITGPTDYTAGADYWSGSDASQSYLKVSPCQDKIAFIGGNTLTVHNFNRATGAVTGELKRITGAGAGVGLEFSPDGNRIFWSGLGSIVNWADITGAGSGTVAGSTSWSMQLGPDGRIYCTGASGGTTMGRINTPGGTPSYTSFSTAAGVTTSNGLSNIAWLSPRTPVITATPTATCNIYTFSFVFRNYFGTNVAINNASITWSWGDASGNTTANATPSHTFPTSGGPYTVTLTFRDQSCDHTWTTTIPVTISCPAPVELLNFAGLYKQGHVDLTWQTAKEINNDYFELQRSVDGINFQTIDRIDGAGNSSSVLNYNDTDYGASGTIVYYRLLQHDFDGTVSASQIIAVRLDKIGTVPVVVMPNPFSGSFTLTKIYPEAATVSVYDVLGRLLEQKSSNETETNLVLGESLSIGSYILKYATSTSSYTLRVEKK